MAMIDEDDCPQGLPAWLATFGDLMSLLLTFFVLLLSFSSTEVVKFHHAMGSLQGSLGIFNTDPELSQPIMVNLPMVRGSVSQSNNIRKAAENLEKSLSDEGLEGDVELTGTASGIVIRIRAPVLYGLGKAEIGPEVYPLLLKVGQLLRLLPNDVIVQGHTDDVPIHTAFPSNWELSLQRAINVVRFLITESRVFPQRISAEGYGPYLPLVSNTTEEGRDRNRRVEVHVLYAGEAEGNLEILSEVFQSYNLQGSREDGSPILKRRRGR
jgi:chemotaxis protein MotB